MYKNRNIPDIVFIKVPRIIREPIELHTTDLRLTTENQNKRRFRIENGR